MDIHSSRGTTNISGRKKHLDCRNSHGSNKEFRESAIDCSRIEREFLLEVGRAEELAGGLGLSNGTQLNSSILRVMLDTCNLIMTFLFV